MANPNIATTTVINGNTAFVANVSTSGSTAISAVTSNHVYKLNTVIVANKSASLTWATLQVVRSSVTYTLAFQVNIPVNGSLVILDKSNPIYLQEGDYVVILAGASNALDAVLSYEDIS